MRGAGQRDEQRKSSSSHELLLRRKEEKNLWVKGLADRRGKGVSCRPFATFRVAASGWVRMGLGREEGGGSHTSEGHCELISTSERGGRGGRGSEKERRGAKQRDEGREEGEGEGWASRPSCKTRSRMGWGGGVRVMGLAAEEV